MLPSNIILPKKETGLLEEITDSRDEAGNIQHEPGVSYNVRKFKKISKAKGLSLKNKVKKRNRIDKGKIVTKHKKQRYSNAFNIKGLNLGMGYSSLLLMRIQDDFTFLKKS